MPQRHESEYEHGGDGHVLGTPKWNVNISVTLRSVNVDSGWESILPHYP